MHCFPLPASSNELKDREFEMLYFSKESNMSNIMNW